MITKKIHAARKFPTPPPHNFFNGSSGLQYLLRLIDSLSWDTLDDRQHYVNAISMYRKPSIN